MNMNQIVENVIHMLRQRSGSASGSRMQKVDLDSSPDLVYKSSDDSIVFVVGNSGPKLTVRTLRSVISFFDKCRHFIFVNDVEPTTFSKKEALKHPTKEFEYFLTTTFRFKLTSHKLYCDHRRLDDKEKQDLQFDPSQLPVLLQSDVVASYFNFKKDDVVEICFPHFSGNLMKVYRIVK